MPFRHVETFSRVHAFTRGLVFVVAGFFCWSCIAITLITCLKHHKYQGLLYFPVDGQKTWSSIFNSRKGKSKQGLKYCRENIKDRNKIVGRKRKVFDTIAASLMWAIKAILERGGQFDLGRKRTWQINLRHSQQVLMRASKARRGIAESSSPAVPRLALPCFELLHAPNTKDTDEIIGKRE